MIYGHDRTIHGTEYVDVEVDPSGEVVSVWFRCMLLPFTQDKVPAQRAEEMRRAYARPLPYRLVAVDLATSS